VRNRIAVADAAVTAVDYGLAAADVAEDFAGSSDGLCLGVEVAAGAVGVRLLNVPATVRVRDDVALFSWHLVLQSINRRRRA
jgi:hypothetical protein